MGIRRAAIDDWKGIRLLLDQLGYPGTEGFLEERIGQLIAHPGEVLLVYEGEAEQPGGERPGILGFISLHFIPQLAVKGDFARISYFAVDEAARSLGIGKKMETYCEQLARERGCDRIEVHCHTRRERAHIFYERQGYIESPKYLIKKL
jgi:GNAT superfamily N-acetyltransferase